MVMPKHRMNVRNPSNSKRGTEICKNGVRMLKICEEQERSMKHLDICLDLTKNQIKQYRVEKKATHSGVSRKLTNFGKSSNK